MSETLEECLARAAACRAAAASEVLDSVRRVHLKAATSWEILGERARWVAPPRDMPDCAHPRVEDDGENLSCRMPSQEDVFPVEAVGEQTDVGRRLSNVEINSADPITSCERAEKSRPCEAEEAQQPCAIMLYADDGHLRKLRQIEADLIRLAIQLYDGRMVEVARRLGIGRSTLYRKMSASGLIQGDDAYSDKATLERH